MSAAPRPYSLPSRAVISKGGSVQSCPSMGTTSVWPDSMTPGGPAGAKTITAHAGMRCWQEGSTMRDPRYDILFEPVKIGPVTAKNRFYQVPHCNGGGYRDASAAAEMRRIKSEGGWGVIFTE